MSVDQSQPRACGTSREKLLLLRDEALTDQDREIVLAHLESCQECNEEYSELVRFEEEYRKRAAEREPVSDSLKKGLRDRYRAACGIWRAREERRRRKAQRWFAAAAAVVVLVAGSWLMLTIWPEENPIRTFEMRSLDKVRGTNALKLGTRYRLQVALSTSLYFHVVHLEGDQSVQVWFPWLDAPQDDSKYLGHKDNRLPASSAVSIPAADFPAALLIEGPRGVKHIIAFGTPHYIPEPELRRFQEELSREAVKGKQAGLGAGAIAENLRTLIEDRYDAVEMITYTVK